MPRNILKDKTVLFVCHINDLNTTVNGGLESKILYPIKEKLKKNNINVIEYLYPTSRQLKISTIYFEIIRLLDIGFEIILKKFKYKRKLRNFWYLNQLNYFKPELILTIGIDLSLCYAANIKKIGIYEVFHGRGYVKDEWGYLNYDDLFLPKGLITTDKTSYLTYKELFENRKVEIAYTERDKYSFDSVELDVSQYKKCILFTMQWGYDGTIDHFEKIDDGVFPAVLNDLFKSDEFYWIIKLHPKQINEKNFFNEFLDLLNDKFKAKNNFYIAKHETIESLSFYCDCHISMSSMSTYECAENGVRSLLLCKSLINDGLNNNLFFDLKQLDFVTLDPYISKSALLTWINNQRKVNVFSSSDSPCTTSDYILELINK